MHQPYFGSNIHWSVQLVRDSILPELASLFCRWKFEAGIPYCRAHPPGSAFCVAGAALGALQGVRCTPWRPLHGLCWLLRGRRGTWCSARGRMYALASLGLRSSAGGFCVAGAALGALQGADVRLASLGLRCSAGDFCVAGAALGAPQGVGCTPWRPLVSGALPLAFAWQAQHLVLCKGSDVRPGVPWSPLAFAWQARHLVLCKGSDVYALASLGLRCSAGGFCVAGAALGALQGVGCTPWRPYQEPINIGSTYNVRTPR